MATTIDRTKVGSAFDLLNKCWDVFKNNWQMFIIVNVFTMLSAVIYSLRTDEERSNASILATAAPGFEAIELGSGYLALAVLIILIVVFFYAMTTVLQVRAGRGEQPGFGILFADGRKYFIRLLGLSIVSALLVIGGLILLIVPGIIIFGRIVMSAYFMVDKDLSIGDSLRASNDQAKGNAGLIWTAIGVYFALSIVLGIFEVVPIIGAVISSIGGIIVSMLLPLRYFELKRATVKKKDS